MKPMIKLTEKETAKMFKDHWYEYTDGLSKAFWLGKKEPLISNKEIRSLIKQLREAL